MSTIACPLPIAGALEAVSLIAGPSRIWRPTNDEQRIFLNTDFYPELRLALAEYLPELASIASFSAADINRFLEERKFDIKLEEFKPNQFGTATALDVMLQWLEAGSSTHIWYGGQKYPAVNLTRAQGIEFFKAGCFSGHEHPVVKISTQSHGDYVYITVLNHPRENLINQAQDIINSLGHRLRRYEEVVFPKIDLSQQFTLDWLVGMTTHSQDGVPIQIAKALQQIKLKMNETGARVKGAAGMVCDILGESSTLYINQPFLLCVVREGLPRPMFTGYITSEDWKDPGNL